MADDTPTAETTEPPACQACRGTGKVVSNLGGAPSEVACPWCEGSGLFIVGHDAQAKRSAESATDAETPVAQPDSEVDSASETASGG